jgi:hypothetical protein
MSDPTELTDEWMRVMFSTGAIWRMPVPGAPMRHARAPFSASSAVGTARVPTLSLRRWRRMLLESGDGKGGRRTGTRKSERPPVPWADSERARATDIFPSAALENHLKPSRR